MSYRNKEVNMPNRLKEKEQRQFLRVDYSKPLAYKIIGGPKKDDIASKVITAVSKNLSGAGILFTTNVTKVPEIASMVVLELDYQTASVCEEIENQALILDSKIIGRVVRIEDNEDDTCGVGVAFVRKSEPILPILKDIEDLIK